MNARAVLLVGSIVSACGGPPPSNTASTPAAPALDSRAADACRGLGSGDLSTRVDATRVLLRDFVTPAVVGGTEQQMEAAAAYCERTTGARYEWLPRKTQP